MESFSASGKFRKFTAKLSKLSICESFPYILIGKSVRWIFENVNKQLSAWKDCHVLEIPLMLAGNKNFPMNAKTSSNKSDCKLLATSQLSSGRVQETQQVFKVLQNVFQKLINVKFSAKLCESCECGLSVWRECAAGKMANSNKKNIRMCDAQKISRNTRLNSAETDRLYRVALPLFFFSVVTSVMWFRNNEKVLYFFAIHSHTHCGERRVCSAINNRRETNKWAWSIDTWISFYYISACHTHKRLFKETRLDSMVSWESEMRYEKKLSGAI